MGEEPESSGLSEWEIFAIVVGCLIFVGLLAYAINTMFCGKPEKVTNFTPRSAEHFFGHEKYLQTFRECKDKVGKDFAKKNAWYKTLCETYMQEAGSKSGLRKE